MKDILKEIALTEAGSKTPVGYRLEKALEKTSYKVFDVKTNKQIGFITFLGYNVPLELRASSAGQGWYYKVLSKGDTESVIGNTGKLSGRKFLTKEIAAKELMKFLDPSLPEN